MGLGSMTVADADPVAAANGRPVWQANKESINCTKCERPFGVFYRRHHCRGCGMLVCDKCSEHRIELPETYGYGPGKVRVCGPCYELALTLRYEADLQKGAVSAPDFGALKQQLTEVAKRYLSLPEAGWNTKVDRGVSIGTRHVEGSSLMAVRSQVTIKASLEKVRKVYGNMELWKNWNPYVSSRLVEQVDPTSKVVVGSYEFPVLKTRDSVFFSFVFPGLVTDSDANGVVTTLAASIEHPKCPKVRGVIRAHTIISINVLEEIDEGNATRLTTLVHSDPRGLLPPMLVNGFLSRGADHLRGMADYVEST